MGVPLCFGSRCILFSSLALLQVYWRWGCNELTVSELLSFICRIFVHLAHKIVNLIRLSGPLMLNIVLRVDARAFIEVIQRIRYHPPRLPRFIPVHLLTVLFIICCLFFFTSATLQFRGTLFTFHYTYSVLQWRLLVTFQISILQTKYYQN